MPSQEPTAIVVDLVVVVNLDGDLNVDRDENP